VTAFVNVNVVPLDHEGIIPGQTVIVFGSRIAAVGPTDKIVVPQDATVIQGNGRYLMPGLADMHVHLEPAVHARRDFADAPLYLAYGITTVLNLHGLPEHLEWRRRIQGGELLAPNLYTAGEFINEPLVRTPDEVEQEVISQFRAGYDVLKYHPIVDTQAWKILTTQGLSGSAFIRMAETAQRLGIPLIGHAPENLPLELALNEHESLAHGGEFVPAYFFPKRHVEYYALLTAGLFALVLVSLLVWLVGAIVRRALKLGTASASMPTSTFRNLALGLVMLGFVCLGLSVALILSGNIPLLTLDTVSVLGLGAIAIAMAVLTMRAWRRKSDSTWARVNFSVAGIAAVAFFASMCHWVPILWRSSEFGITRIARLTRAASVWVEPTLVLYDPMRWTSEQRELALNERAFKAMPPSVRQRWQHMETKDLVPPWQRIVFRNQPEFTRKLTRALYEAGVPLMVGTDAPGVPLEPPGAFAHRELKLLLESGLSPYEALRAATTNAAAFLHRENEFGTVTVGKRADLLLVRDNPLQDVGTAREPVGVMVRGDWLPEKEIQRMLDAIADREQ
jgi:hypothetical protein